jgi:ribosomal protein S4
MVDKNKAVVCCLLATSAIMFSEKKKRKCKMWSKKWYLKRNISRDAQLLNELLETHVEDCINYLVSAGKMRKLWDSLSELQSSLCERRLERTVLRPALLSVKTAQFTQFFRQVRRHTVKSLSLTESV